MWSLGCILGELLLGKPIFPGTSTLNQLDRILELIGRPSSEDIESIQSGLAGTMLEALPQNKNRGWHEFFPTASDEGLDLLKKLLVFNPNKRLTAEQALKHSYVSEFHNPDEEEECGRTIEIGIDDNTKFSIREYRDKLYQEILKKKKEQRKNILSRIDELKPSSSNYTTYNQNNEAKHFAHNYNQVNEVKGFNNEIRNFNNNKIYSGGNNYSQNNQNHRKETHETNNNNFLKDNSYNNKESSSNNMIHNINNNKIAIQNTAEEEEKARFEKPNKKSIEQLIDYRRKLAKQQANNSLVNKKIIATVKPPSPQNSNSINNFGSIGQLNKNLAPKIIANSGSNAINKGKNEKIEKVEKNEKTEKNDNSSNTMNSLGKGGIPSSIVYRSHNIRGAYGKLG